MKTIDIHGKIQSEALILLNGFLKESYLNREYFILIIHGHGKQVLQKMVHSRLGESKYVLSFEYAPPQLGGTGATLVYLNKRGI